ncbi:MAG: type II toxin-antitoxin system HicB family antitoxin [Candidatus Omnitrophica bacterium]|nr:type II toxin-antitoxin system HicB family antitoxin [Candidatus Omnitrophota bacterium]
MIQYRVEVPVSIFKEGDRFVAHCPVLDLSTSGRTFEQVRGRFQEALHMFIEDLAEQGTLDEVLQSYGWHKVSKPRPHWAPPKLVSSSAQEASIPVGA